MAGVAVAYNRAKEVKEFDDTKLGVKGLVDSGITTIPRFFHHPNLHLSSSSSLSIPTVDLSHPQPDVVDLLARACREWGFFQLTNHGIPVQAIDDAISAVRSFHELPPETKAGYYTRDFTHGVAFASNFDLFHSDAPGWLDTLMLRMGPVRTRAEPDRLPEVCREALVAWDEHVRVLGERVMGWLCEGLGVGPERLKELSCLEGRGMVCHCYPYCPEPDRTLGIWVHTDPGLLTVVLQDQTGGLQVLKDGLWVEVKPSPGALVVNVGDLLQIISNDVYKSVEHRVVANPFQKPRISIGLSFIPGKEEDCDYYGPLLELVSPEKPALYRNFLMSEFRKRFDSGRMHSRSMVEHFKL